ncbi:MAG: hypothetical protein RL034_735, partial [Bacteroidota bacterium]
AAKAAPALGADNNQIKLDFTIN